MQIIIRVKHFRIMRNSYLYYKNCFIETKQNSKHFPNLMTKCLAILHHVELSVAAKVC